MNGRPDIVPVSEVKTYPSKRLDPSLGLSRPPNTSRDASGGAMSTTPGRAMTSPIPERDGSGQSDGSLWVPATDAVSLGTTDTTSTRTRSTTPPPTSPSSAAPATWPPTGVEPYYLDESVCILHGDCREILPCVQADVLVTDPPYGIGFRNDPRRCASPSGVRSSGGAYGRDWGAIVGDDAPFDPAPLLALGLPSILWGAHCYASRLPDSAGWLVWDKKRGGTVGRGFVSSDVDLAWTNWLGHTLVYVHLWDGLRRDSEVGQHFHPTQKPLELMRWCIGLAPSGVILDPFMGSGTTLRAAKDLGRLAIGIEIEERYAEIAAKRMGQEVLAL